MKSIQGQSQTVALTCLMFVQNVVSFSWRSAPSGRALVSTGTDSLQIIRISVTRNGFSLPRRIFLLFTTLFEPLDYLSSWPPPSADPFVHAGVLLNQDTNSLTNKAKETGAALELSRPWTDLLSSRRLRIPPRLGAEPPGYGKLYEIVTRPKLSLCALCLGLLSLVSNYFLFNIFFSHYL